MSYPKLKLNKTEISLDPSLIKVIKEQVPGQLKAMTFREIMDLGKAIRSLLLDIPLLVNMARLLK